MHASLQDSRPAPRKVALVLAIGVCSISTGAILVRMADCAPLTKAAWRCALAAIILGVSGGARRPSTAPQGRVIGLALMAGALLAFHFGTWIASLDSTSVARSSLLVATTPIWVAMASPFVTTDRPTWRALLGVAISLAGSAWIALDDPGGGETKGALLALAGALGAAGYVLVGRRVGSRIPIQRYLFLCYGSAALWLIIAARANGDALFGFDGKTWAALIGLAMVPQLLGHSACNWALRWLPALLVSVVFLAEPIVASILAWLFLQETPGLVVLLAAPLILAGIVLAADARTNPPPSDEQPAV